MAQSRDQKRNAKKAQRAKREVAKKGRAPGAAPAGPSLTSGAPSWFVATAFMGRQGTGAGDEVTPRAPPTRLPLEAANERVLSAMRADMAELRDAGRHGLFPARAGRTPSCRATASPRA